MPRGHTEETVLPGPTKLEKHLETHLVSNQHLPVETPPEHAENENPPLTDAPTPPARIMNHVHASAPSASSSSEFCKPTELLQEVASLYQTLTELQKEYDDIGEDLGATKLGGHITEFFPELSLVRILKRGAAEDLETVRKKRSREQEIEEQLNGFRSARAHKW